jgi:hypothetical protein
MKRIFELSEEQNKKFASWYDSLPDAYYGAVGGGLHFVFTPTGLGTIVCVKRDDGYEIDLTDWENF